MLYIKHIVIGLFLLTMLGGFCPAKAANLTINMPGIGASTPFAQALPVQWGQSSINMSQLQNIFAQNPNAQQFQIQFPGGVNWNVTPASIQSLYSEYTRKSAALGLGQVPDLSFSALGSTALNAAMTTIPVKDGLEAMEQESDAALSTLHDQETSFMNSVAEWFHHMLQVIVNTFVTLYASARDAILSLLGK